MEVNNHSQQPDVKEISSSLGGRECTEKSGNVKGGTSTKYFPAGTYNKGFGGGKWK